MLQKSLYSLVTKYQAQPIGILFILSSCQRGASLNEFQKGTIHLRRQHALGAEGCVHLPMVKRSQYIRIKNPLHKHIAGMPMVGG